MNTCTWYSCDWFQGLKSPLPVSFLPTLYKFDYGTSFSKKHKQKSLMLFPRGLFEEICALFVPIPAQSVTIPGCVHIPYSRTFRSVFAEVLLYTQMSYCMVLSKVQFVFFPSIKSSECCLRWIDYHICSAQLFFIVQKAFYLHINKAKWVTCVWLLIFDTVYVLVFKSRFS